MASGVYFGASGGGGDAAAASRSAIFAMTSASGSLPRMRRSQACVLEPSGRCRPSSIGVSGISACTAVASARPMALVVETTMQARVQQDVHDLAEAAHQLGLRGVDPQVVVDAEQHVLAVQHVDVAAGVEQRALERARVRVLAGAGLADEHDQRRAVAVALRRGRRR